MLIERINEFIIAKSKQKSFHSNNFYCSTLDECAKSIYYSKLGFEKKPMFPTRASDIRRMDYGSAIHEYYQNLFKEMELIKEVGDIEKSILDKENKISGRIDAIITTEDALKHIIEIKTIDNYSKLNDLPYKGHVWQIQMYMHLTGIKSGYLFYAFLTKPWKKLEHRNKIGETDLDLFEIKIEYDPEMVKEIYQKIFDIVSALDKKIVPNVQYGSFKNCEYCNYSYLCRGIIDTKQDFTADLSHIFEHTY